jgi:hypothetical protein
MQLSWKERNRKASKTERITCNQRRAAAISSYMMHSIVVTAPASTSASHESFKLANLLIQSTSSLGDCSLELTHARS